MAMAIYVMVGIYLSMLLVYPLITILHEMGHALAYLALTRPDRIDIFIGTYRDKDTRLKFVLGKLHFYIKLKFPYVTGGGMCQSHTAERNYAKRMVILLAGPVFTLLIALLLGAVAFSTEVHGAVKLFCFVLIILSAISLINNLSPATISAYDLDSDGRQLAFVMRAKSLYHDYVNGLLWLGEGEYEQCINAMLKVNNKVQNNARILRAIATSYLQLGDYPAAEEYLYRLKEINQLNLQDHLHRGYVFSRTDRPELAMGDYRRVLKRDKNNLFALNNLGYHLSLAGKYDEAEQLLTKAIAIAPEWGYTYNNMAHVKLMTGWLDKGKELIDKSLELEPDNAYAYKNLGIYYISTKNKSMALESINKAIEMDAFVNAGDLLAEAEAMP
jgi:Tfp pilus assembly protein PilF